MKRNQNKKSENIKPQLPTVVLVEVQKEQADLTTNQQFLFTQSVWEY